MDDQTTQIEQEIRSEIKRARKAPKRERGVGFRRALPLLLVLAAVLGAVGFAASRGVTGADSLRRLLSYNKVEQDADGKAELFRYDSDRTATYTPLGDGLLVVSSTRLQLLGSDGEELWSKTVNFSNPAVALGGASAAVCDVGGRELYVLDAHGLKRDMSGETGNGILAVTINASDYLALTTLKSGYRASVTAYNPSGEPVFAFHSSESYLSDARVLDDNRHLAAVTLGEADGVFACTLTLYSFDSEKPVSETTFSGAMVLSLGSVGGRLAALQDDRLTLIGADGSLAGNYRFEYPYLRDASLDGDGFAALLLSRYRSGSALRLVTVDAEGNVLGSLDERREIMSISAAGSYVAVLYGDSLTVYRADLTEFVTLSGAEFAKRAVVRADGTVLLIGASRAWLYIPE